MLSPRPWPCMGCTLQQVGLAEHQLHSEITSLLTCCLPKTLLRPKSPLRLLVNSFREHASPPKRALRCVSSLWRGIFCSQNAT